MIRPWERRGQPGESSNPVTSGNSCTRLGQRGEWGGHCRCVRGAGGGAELGGRSKKKRLGGWDNMEWFHDLIFIFYFEF